MKWLTGRQTRDVDTVCLDPLDYPQESRYFAAVLPDTFCSASPPAMQTRTSVAVIGAGISGLVAACYLAKQGHTVCVYEKHESPGGRARRFETDGFRFDMGPSWYWMPDVFEKLFNDFGKTASDYYELTRLSPSYDVFFEDRKVEIPASPDALGELFESIEPGSAARLKEYLSDAEVKYHLGMGKFALKPGLSLIEFMSWDLVSSAGKLKLFSSTGNHVDRYFSHPVIRKIMQFPVIFLGAMPHRIPAMYSLMNYADSVLGTWYPQGGMYRIVEALHALAKELGVHFHFNSDVDQIEVDAGQARRMHINGESVEVDILIGSGDYYHIESLLPEQSRSYTSDYWEKRKMAPSCLLYYIGVDKKLPLNHHTLFFDGAYEGHARQLYEDPEWPDNPLFYVCAPSVTDPTVAPDGHENLFILIPVAAGLEGDDEALRRKYLDLTLSRMEKKLDTPIKQHIVYTRMYSISDFQDDYHAFKGNAYGLANTLTQTAVLKPRMRSRKVSNLFYCGQLTVPGPGLPPAILSGKIAADEAQKYLADRTKRIRT